jgi:hypothetical protein
MELYMLSLNTTLKAHRLSNLKNCPISLDNYVFPLGNPNSLAVVIQ